MQDLKPSLIMVKNNYIITISSIVLSIFLDDQKKIPETKEKQPDDTSRNKEDNIEIHSDEITVKDVTVKLLDNNIWNDFHKLATEMIITKAGR